MHCRARLGRRRLVPRRARDHRRLRRARRPAAAVCEQARARRPGPDRAAAQRAGPATAHDAPGMAGAARHVARLALAARRGRRRVPARAQPGGLTAIRLGSVRQRLAPSVAARGPRYSETANSQGCESAPRSEWHRLHATTPRIVYQRVNGLFAHSDLTWEHAARCGSERPVVTQQKNEWPRT